MSSTAATEHAGGKRWCVDRYDAMLWAVALVALAVRLYDLDGPSVWLDETASRSDMAAPLAAIFARVAYPPLYFLLLRVWSAVLGESWWTLRAFSAVAGSLSVVVFGRIVRELFGGRSLMLGAAATFALMPQSLQSSREVRMYSLWVLWILVATLGAVRVARAARPSRRDFVLYWVGIAAAAATHHYTAVYAAALGAGTYVLTGRHWLWKERDDWKRLAVLHGPIVLVAAFEVTAVLALSGYGGSDLIAKVRRDLRGVVLFEPLRDVTAQVFFRNWTYEDRGIDRPFGLREALMLVSLAGTAALAWVSKRGRRGVVFLATVGIAPVVVLSALPVRSYTRLLSPSLPFLVALLAFGVWRLFRQSRWRWLLLPVGAAGLWLLVPAALDVYRVEIEPWKSVCAAVSAPAGKSAGVLLNEPYMRPPFDVCFTRPYPVRTFPRDHRFDPEWIRAFIRDKRVVWLIYAHAWRSDPRRRALGVVTREGFRLRRMKSYGPVIETYLLLRRHQRPKDLAAR